MTPFELLIVGLFGAFLVILLVGLIGAWPFLVKLGRPTPMQVTYERSVVLEMRRVTTRLSVPVTEAWSDPYEVMRRGEEIMNRAIDQSADAMYGPATADPPSEDETTEVDW